MSSSNTYKGRVYDKYPTISYIYVYSQPPAFISLLDSHQFDKPPKADMSTHLNDMVSSSGDLDHQKTPSAEGVEARCAGYEDLRRAISEASVHLTQMKTQLDDISKQMEALLRIQEQPASPDQAAKQEIPVSFWVDFR